jgi:hypothetical protein
MNLFAYVAGNPVSRIDPKGLDFSAAIAMQMPRLAAIWAAALAEPTPFGEAVAGVVTAYLVAKNLEAFSDAASISPYEYELLSMTGPVFATDAKSLEEYLKHKKKLEEALEELQELKKALEKAKGAKACKEIGEEIRDLEKSIKGHEKEVRQKWPNGRPEK